jgi:protein transport protein SEC24
MDLEQRPELRLGSIEFEVPEAYYSSKKPAPISHVFAIDVSFSAIKSGLTSTVCEALRRSLFDIEPHSSLLPENARIGIMTFDHSVHFYNIHVSIGCHVIHTTDAMLIFFDDSPIVSKRR